MLEPVVKSSRRRNVLICFRADAACAMPTTWCVYATGGACFVRHARRVPFQMAEVMIPPALFAQIFARIARLTPVGGTG